jgi:hypothetical protein
VQQVEMIQLFCGHYSLDQIETGTGAVRHSNCNGTIERHHH